MGSVKDYFSSLGTGIASLLKGMQVTGKELVTRKITEEYPDNRLEIILFVTCERNCPNGTIKIESKMVDTLAGKKKKLDRYIYDLGSCTFCQLCVTTCPTKASSSATISSRLSSPATSSSRSSTISPRRKSPLPRPSR